MKTILDYETGLHRGVPPSIYHARIGGLVSKGALDLVHRSPLHYKAWLDGAPEEKSEALYFGDAFHAALLEPARYERDYVIMPTWDELRDKAGRLSTKEGKAAKTAWLEEHKGCTVVEPEWKDRIAAMVASVRAHPLASRIIADGEPEVTVRWRDDQTGLQCKTRMDYYVGARRMVADVKSTDDASRESFRRSVATYRYHVQDALYRAGMAAVGCPVEHFVFVVVEKRAPHAVATYTLDADGIARGYSDARRDIEALAKCVAEDAWPGYPVGIQELDVPPWAA